MTQRLSAIADPETVDDDDLLSFGATGHESTDVERGSPLRGGYESNAAPFDISLPRPRAIDLREMWRLAGKVPDAEILAALGANVPVLISHGITAFPQAGRKPPRVWGLGYDCSVFGTDADTVAVTPTTELTDVIRLGTEAKVEVKLSGEMGIPSATRTMLNQVPEIMLNDASVEASIDQTAALTLAFIVSMPRVISGPDASGGAKWRLYSRERQIAGYQPLLQTILVPEGTRTLRMEARCWVREAGWFGRPRGWRFETASWAIDLRGLRDGAASP